MENRPSPRVLMMSAQFLPEVYGGAEQQCRRLCLALMERGVKVTLLTSRSSRTFAGQERLDGIDVVRPYTVFPPDLIGRYIGASVWWYLWTQRWFSRRAGEFDLLHVHQFKFPVFVAAALKRRSGLPLIVKPGNAGLHSDLASVRRKRLVGPYLYRTAIAAPDRFVAISTEIDQELAAHGVPAGRRCLIPNGVTQPYAAEELAAAKAAARQQLASDAGNDRIFVFTGRFEPVKNLSACLHAFARALAATPQARAQLWLLGVGSEEAALRGLVESLNLGGRVRFWGYQKNVIPYLLAADAFVLPSIAEGMSNALLEAMAVGLVPVSTPVSGSHDLVAAGTNGWLAADSSEAAIAAVLTDAMAAPPARFAAMGRAAFQTIASRYAMASVADQYLSLYDQLRK